MIIVWKHQEVCGKRDDLNDNTAQSESLKYKIKITGKTPAAGNTKDVKIVVPLKYLSNFWRTLEIPLINCEISLDLTWSKKCIISSAVGITEFIITDTKHFVPVVTLSTGDNVKLLKQLESGFNKAINWNKYYPKLKKKQNVSKKLVLKLYNRSKFSGSK